MNDVYVVVKMFFDNKFKNLCSYVDGATKWSSHGLTFDVSAKRDVKEGAIAQRSNSKKLKPDFKGQSVKNTTQTLNLGIMSLVDGTSETAKIAIEKLVESS